MEASLTEFRALNIPILVKARSLPVEPKVAHEYQKSAILLDQIYQTLNSPSNYRSERPHKMSLSAEDTHQTIITKCKCKKSKCLKLYCECFSNGTISLT